MPTIEVTPEIVIDQSELAFSFARAGGPGGQNEVETAVQLRFDVAHSPSLDDTVKRRLKRLGGRQAHQGRLLVIFARAHRSQERNRQDALARLLRLIAAAAAKPEFRVKTRPGMAAREHRIETKVWRGETKRLRSSPVEEATSTKPKRRRLRRWTGKAIPARKNLSPRGIGLFGEGSRPGAARRPPLASPRNSSNNIPIAH
jgi:ribosome-associated protein